VIPIEQARAARRRRASTGPADAEDLAERHRCSWQAERARVTRVPRRARAQAVLGERSAED
jgi:hypothetical protein